MTLSDSQDREKVETKMTTFVQENDFGSTLFSFVFEHATILFSFRILNIQFLVFFLAFFDYSSILKFS